MYCAKFFLGRVGWKCKPYPHMCRIDPGCLAIVPEAAQMPQTSIKGYFLEAYKDTAGVIVPA